MNQLELVFETRDSRDLRQRALDPAASVWVSASAGTGKTRILTERLLTLMLDGTDPSRILCLTFTRAAAAEMANRVNARLAEWTTMPPGALDQELQKLTGHVPDAYERDRARQLFARVLDTPGGAKIATIHAFCQSLLRRFPLEAGIAPEFAVIDERSAEEALTDAAETVIAEARAGNRRLAEALAAVSRYAAEERFAELRQALARDRAKLRAILAEGEDALRDTLGAELGIGVEDTPESLARAFCNGTDEAALRRVAAALCVGSKTDCKRGEIIARWCEDGATRIELIDEYVRSFLTNDGGIYSRLLTKGTADTAGPEIVGSLQSEAERALHYREAHAAAASRDATLALVRIGAALIEAYERRKRLHALLDYDDLVLRALDLLRRPGLAPWVLFKLDGGLDHILIDEAQDTNPEQWQIVALLAEEFFAGEGARERNRTVFAVGDAKQSIYSFQGADPGAFLHMRRHFQQRVDAARQPWCVVPLEISFRASEPLLAAVDAVFRSEEAASGVALDGEPIRHIASRQGHGGIVELWPPAPVPADDIAGTGRRPVEPHTRLARTIAATIRHWLDNGEQLEGRGRALRPGDIMVLVRRRHRFVADLLRALKQRGIPVAGADRLVLTDQLAVQDLVALGRFLLLPEDDLTLATVLKGPLFDISEDDLFLLAYGREPYERLWNRVQRFAGEYPAIGRAHERLSALLARADFVPPFELFAEVLGTADGRRHMLERLGPEAADPIDEFLALALTYEREHVPSLQGFLHWLVAGEIEIKRDFGERQRDELRILTVHGAKGLEAPVVFVPDTMQLPDRPEALLWSERDGLPLWCPHKELKTPRYNADYRAARQRQFEEYRRLLYVALTRAQDRLYLCGWQMRNQSQEAASWHTLCQAGWRGLAEPFAFDSRPRGRRRIRLGRRRATAGGATDGAAGRRPTGAGRLAAPLRCRAGRSTHRRASLTRRSRSCRHGRAAASLRPCRRSLPPGATGSSAASGAQIIAEPAGASGSGARARGASFSRIAGARAHRRGAGGNLLRDAGGDRRAGVCRSLGTGRTGRGAGRVD